MADPNDLLTPPAPYLESLRLQLAPLPNTPDRPGNLESAPEPPSLDVLPRYWHHTCPRSRFPRRNWHQLIPPLDGVVPVGTPCDLGCGYRANRDTELHNHAQQPVALLGGRSLMPGRLERWWMRCPLCGNTWRNYLEDHQFVVQALEEQEREEREEGRTTGTRTAGSAASGRGEATKCASCAVPFASSAVPLNRYGEEVEPLRKAHAEYWEAEDLATATLRRVSSVVGLSRYWS